MSKRKTKPVATKETEESDEIEEVEEVEEPKKNSKKDSKKDLKKDSKKEAQTDASEPNETTTTTEPSEATAAVKVYKYKELKFKNAKVSSLNKNGTQPMAFITYNDPLLNSENKILMQSGHIKMTSGNPIPPLDKDNQNSKGYYPDDSKREFLKIPLDPNQDSCIELRKHLEEADKWAGSEETRKKLFGSNWKKYVYTTCIKSPKIDDDEDEDDDAKGKKGKKEKPKLVMAKDGKEYRVRVGKDGKDYIVMDFVKMKFNVCIEKKDDKNKNKKNNNNNDEDDENNKGVRTIKTKIKKVLGKGNKKLMEINSIGDIAKEIKYQSEIRFIFYYGKIWANKTASTGTDVKAYGLGLKLMSIEYTPGKSTINTQDVEFRSDDEDGGDDNAKETKSSSKKSPKLDDDDEENENEENEEKEEKEETKKSKSKSKTKSKAKSNNSDEEEVPEDEEEEEQEASSKKNKKKKARVEEEEEEEEAEPEEEPEEEEEEDTKSKKKSKSASRSK